MRLKDSIKEYAYSQGFDLVGFTTIKPLLETRRILKQRLGEGYVFPFEVGGVEQITDPRSLLPGARSVIALGMSYSISENLIPPKPEGKFLGLISRYAWGLDYHRVFIQKMKKLGDYINSIKKTNYRVFVDTGSIIDRAVAYRAGLGWISKNTCLANPRYGTWVFLGEIILDIELEPDTPLQNRCGKCERCLDVCPTGALFEPYKLDPMKCLSYLTQKRGWIPREYRSRFGNRLYGCDTCQEECSINSAAVSGNHKEFMPVVLKPYMELTSLFSITNAEFKKTFGRSAAGWAGKNTILRNAVIVLGNSRDEEAEPILLKALKHPSPVIRGHAAWAIARCLKKSRGLICLEKALSTENNDEVKHEIIQSIKIIQGERKQDD